MPGAIDGYSICELRFANRPTRLDRFPIFAKRSLVSQHIQPNSAIPSPGNETRRNERWHTLGDHIAIGVRTSLIDRPIISARPVGRDAV